MLHIYQAKVAIIQHHVCYQRIIYSNIIGIYPYSPFFFVVKCASLFKGPNDAVPCATKEKHESYFQNITFWKVLNSIHTKFFLHTAAHKQDISTIPSSRIFSLLRTPLEVACPLQSVTHPLIQLALKSSSGNKGYWTKLRTVVPEHLLVGESKKIQYTFTCLRC